MSCQAYRPVEFTVWDYEDGTPRRVMLQPDDIVVGMDFMTEGECTGWTYRLLRLVEAEKP